MISFKLGLKYNSILLL